MIGDTLAWRNFVAGAAVTTTIVQFLAGSLVCKKIILKGSTGESSGFPFVCGLLSSSLWLRYGLLKGDSTIVLVNSIGSALLFLYMMIYYYYVPKKNIFTCQVSIVIFLITSLYGYSIYEVDHESSLKRIGTLSCLVTILFIAAPLTMLFHVIRVKSTESLPFPMILMSFLVCLLWYIYGVIVHDAFMQIPNAIGGILAVLQLSLFFIYPNTTVQYTKLSQINQL